MDKKNRTIYDIAKEAQVSPATVSRVLTGNANVSTEKMIKVQNIIKKHDFQPNALARIIKNKKSNVIGFIVPDITNPFFSTIFFEVEKLALSNGFTMMLCDSMNSGILEYSHIRSLSERQVESIVFMGGRVNHLHTKPKYADEMNSILKNTPIVIVNGKMTGVDCHTICTDEKKGIHELVDLLVSQGHKNIGLIGGVSTTTSTEIKNSAFRESLKTHKLKYNRDWVVTEEFTIESGYNCMKKVLQCKRRPTAVMCINDFVALGAIRAARECGFSIPGDISITGFDGTYISEVVDPKLTTVSQNYKVLAEKIVQTILEIINNEESDKEKIVDTKLIVGES